MNAALIAVGSELLRFGHRDTNTLWLRDRLATLGVGTALRAQVDDDPGRIAHLLRTAAGLAEMTILTGGLGPTDDDRTREALARAAGVALERDDEVLARLRGHFERRGYRMTDNNAAQADRPAGAAWVANPVGSADGLRMTLDRATLWSLPGVPAEMRAMFDAAIVPEIAGAAPLAIATRTLRVASRFESSVDAQLAEIYERYETAGVDVTILGGINGLTLHVLARSGESSRAESTADEVAGAIRRRLGDDLFGEGETTLESVVADRLLARGETLACAESCTGGLIAARLTELPGASRWFRGGLVVYDNELKRELAGVEAATLAEHGAVSEPVARRLAEGARRRCGADWALGVTGIAGPGGGSPDKPVGLVHLALAGAETTHHWKLRLPGDRARVRGITVHVALDRLRRALDGLPLALGRG